MTTIDWLGPKPQTARTLGVGQHLTAIVVTFDSDVRIVPHATTGALPRLELALGSKTRYATLLTSASPSNTDRRTFHFRYTVAVGDFDSSGVTANANALQLNGATIVAAADHAVNADISHAALAALTHLVPLPCCPGSFTSDPLEKVDGGPAPTPRVQSVQWEGSGTLLRGDEIRLTFNFSAAVIVTGTPRVPVIVGTTTRYATYSGGSETRALTFRYVVQQADSDTDGVAVNANALELNGGTMYATASNTGDTAGERRNAVSADLSHSALAASAGRRVDGSRVRPVLQRIGAWTPGTRTGEAVARGFEIRIDARLSETVRIVGQPRLRLTIGSQTRYASFRGSRTASTLSFTYTVQAGDSDADGIAVPADAIDLNGGRITSTDGLTAALTHSAVSTTVNVDGGIQRGPRVDEIALLSGPDFHPLLGYGPVNGSSYGRGERITGWVRFHPPVDVTGTPRVALTIGSRTRHAEIFWPADPNVYGNQQLYFTYVVQANDADTVGIAVPANAVQLNGGTIRMRGTATNADLASAASPASDHPYPVNGATAVAPTVQSVALLSGGVARLGDTITAWAWFDHAVEATGTPQLALTVGNTARQASFTTARTIAINGHTLTQSLPDTFGAMLFDYTVQADDLDLDGIAVAADALSLNSGTISLRGGSTTAATLTHDAVDANARALADGLTSIRADDEGPPVVGEPLVAGASDQSYRAEPDPPETSTACDQFAASTSHEPWVWQRSDDGSTGWTDVSASRASDCTYVYVPASGDAGKYFRARIPLTESAATAAGAPSTDRYATTEVTAAAVASSTATAGVGLFRSGHAPPRVNGAIETMMPFTATERHRPHGGWRWRRCDDAAMTTNCELLQDTDGLSYRYTPVADDLNKHIEAWMYFSLDSGASWRRWAASPIGPVQAAGSGGGGGGGVIGSSDPLDPCEADPGACGLPP